MAARVGKRLAAAGGLAGGGEDARRANEDEKRLTGEGQEGLTTVRRFSAG